MFMIATIQTIVSGMPTHAGSAWMPRNGNVKRSTQTPNHVGTAAASSWPPSFSHQRSPRKSSMAPTVDRHRRAEQEPARVAAERQERERRHEDPEEERDARRAAGSGAGSARRPPGASTTPSIRAMPPTAGVSSTTTTKATSAPQMTWR